MQRARRDQRRPAVRAQHLGPLVAVLDAAALAYGAQPGRRRIEDAGPVDQQLMGTFAGDVGDDDMLGRLVGDRERIDVVARRRELDQRYRGDAGPAVAAAVVGLGPAPLDARVAGVDAEDHAGLADTTRSPANVRSPLPVCRRSAPSLERPRAMPVITRPSARRTRSRAPACACILSHSSRKGSSPRVSKSASACSTLPATVPMSRLRSTLT